MKEETAIETEKVAGVKDRPLMRIIRGKVVSIGMDKTCVVLLELVKKHPLFRKNLRRSRKVMVDDPQGIAKEGDLISAIACRPLSKWKRHRLYKVLSQQDGQSKPVTRSSNASERGNKEK